MTEQTQGKHWIKTRAIPVLAVIGLFTAIRWYGNVFDIVQSMLGLHERDPLFGFYVLFFGVGAAIIIWDKLKS